MVVATEYEWQFPEDVIVTRAMVEALITYLAEKSAIDIEQVLKLYRERLETYRKAPEKATAEVT